VICTTDHGLAFPTAKASLLDRGIGVMLIMRGPGFTGGRASTSSSRRSTCSRRLRAGRDRPAPWLGPLAVPLVSGTGRSPGPRCEIFAELTYHAAYEPQRAIRTERFKYIRRFDDYPYPVLPNCDDSPSKDAYLARGWAKRRSRASALHDLFFNPGEGRNLIDDPGLRVVTAEYNYGYPAALKNAIDFLHAEWRHKALGFVSYGGIAAGTRAVQQLRQVTSALGLVSAQMLVNIAFVGNRIGEDGELTADDAMAAAATGMLDELLELNRALALLRR
jgi:hypothetical protein